MLSRIRMLATMLLMTGFVLVLPMRSFAVLSPPSLTDYTGATWLTTIDDRGDIPIAKKAYDIAWAYQGYQAGNYYFHMDMHTGVNKNWYANAYVLHIDGLEFKVELGYTGNTATWDVKTPPAVLDFQHSGTALEWKLSSGLSIAGQTWWIDTLDKDKNIIDTTAHSNVVTPIPGAAWLLGSGLVGLIGLKRRIGRPNTG